MAACARSTKGVANGPTFDYLGARHDGLSIALVGDQYGYADGQGRMAIAPAYLWASDYTNRRAVVSTRSSR